MNTRPEPSNVPVSGKSQWLGGRVLVIGVAIIAVAVFAIALIAGILLANAWPNSDWIPIYQDVLKTSFGALAVGGLGGLAKLAFDQRKAQDAAADEKLNAQETAAEEKRKEREAAAGELRDRRYGFISKLVEVSHDIDTAKLVIRANRSVRSWTEVVNERIIPARSRLGDMTHQLTNWTDANSAVFARTEDIQKELHGMDNYLKSLLEEYGDKKQSLGELQLKAEQAKTTKPETRKQLLDQIWDEMKSLRFLGNLIELDPHPNDGCPSYDAYRENYRQALLMMRRSLENAAQSTVTISSAQGLTTP
jgi:hypothetical protein